MKTVFIGIVFLLLIVASLAYGFQTSLNATAQSVGSGGYFQVLSIENLTSGTAVYCDRNNSNVTTNTAAVVLFTQGSGYIYNNESSTIYCLTATGSSATISWGQK